MAREGKVRLNLAVALLAFPALGPALAQQQAVQPTGLPSSQSTNPPSQVDNLIGTPPPERTGITYFAGVRQSLLFSDNLALRGAGRTSAMVYEVSPYLVFLANEERLRANISYQLRNVFRSAGDDAVTLGRSALSATVTSALRDDWLWVDFTGRIANISASPVGPLSFDPVINNVNVTEVRSFSISPYVRSSSGYADYELRYTYRTSNLGGLLGRTSQAGSAFATTGNRLGRWVLGWNGTTQQIERGDGRTIGRNFSTGSLSYRVNSELQVGATINYDQIDGLTGRNGRDYGYGPGALVNWRPNTRTSLSANFARRYFGNTALVDFNHRLRWLTFSVNHTRQVLSSADGDIFFFNPGSLGATGGGGVPFNPVFSQLLTQGLLQFGLTPFDLAFLTSALVQTERTSVSVGAVGQHNSLLLNVFHNRRRSRGETDTSLAPNDGPRDQGTVGATGSFSGEAIQQGVQLTYRHRLDARSSVSLTTRRTDIEVNGFAGGFASPGNTSLMQYSASYSTRLTTDTIASFLIRRTNQERTGQLGTNFTENAIVGTLDVRF